MCVQTAGHGRAVGERNAGRSRVLSGFCDRLRCSAPPREPPDKRELGRWASIAAAAGDRSRGCRVFQPGVAERLRRLQLAMKVPPVLLLRRGPRTTLQTFRSPAW